MKTVMHYRPLESAGGAELRVTDRAMRRRGGRSNAPTLGRRWMAACWWNARFASNKRIDLARDEAAVSPDVPPWSKRPRVPVGCARVTKQTRSRTTQEAFAPDETSTCTTAPRHGASSPPECHPISSGLRVRDTVSRRSGFRMCRGWETRV